MGKGGKLRGQEIHLRHCPRPSLLFGILGDGRRGCGQNMQAQRGSCTDEPTEICYVIFLSLTHSLSSLSLLLTLSHFLSLSLSHSFTFSITHFLSLSLTDFLSPSLTCSLCLSLTFFLFHSLTFSLSLSHSLTFSLSLSFILKNVAHNRKFTKTHSG